MLTSNLYNNSFVFDEDGIPVINDPADKPDGMPDVAVVFLFDPAAGPA